MTRLADPDPSSATETAREAFGQLIGRSPLLGWMRQNHALITERMNTVRPSWDDIARTLTDQEIPIGLLTNTVGAPFAFLFWRTQARGWVAD